MAFAQGLSGRTGEAVMPSRGFGCTGQPSPCHSAKVHSAQTNLAQLGRRGVSISAKAAAVEAPSKLTTKPSSAPGKNGALISPEVAQDLYKDMKLGREFEEMCAQQYYRGKCFGFVHLYSGQEVSSANEVLQLFKGLHFASVYWHFTGSHDCRLFSLRNVQSL